MDSPLDPRIEEAHHLACEQKLRNYTCPLTETNVFTRYYLRTRGWCCQQGCRHCPFEDIHISMPDKPSGMSQA